MNPDELSVSAQQNLCALEDIARELNVQGENMNQILTNCQVSMLALQEQESQLERVITKQDNFIKRLECYISASQSAEKLVKR